ncbi:uncharacterized protein BDZ99DRAFT_14664 [Mytilinidion resinicola]|uniref:Uncharacterized protein n=1 Tax=Mytilinidion resinicola TaxID=574789 RepID=A0A6A6ZAR1_9PEZI|nr:uncharacterized protein BDZ99DRAFT_14664 [Mytilinidion resinicola]KAF2817385.1 hypothetical protein BDZ99DRAFT_14664 [Mytilinidion resinicola]
MSAARLGFFFKRSEKPARRSSPSIPRTSHTSSDIQRLFHHIPRSRRQSVTMSDPNEFRVPEYLFKRPFEMPDLHHISGDEILGQHSLGSYSAGQNFEGYGESLGSNNPSTVSDSILVAWEVTATVFTLATFRKPIAFPSSYRLQYSIDGTQFRLCNGADRIPVFHASAYSCKRTTSCNSCQSSHSLCDDLDGCTRCVSRLEGLDCFPQAVERDSALYMRPEKIFPAFYSDTVRPHDEIEVFNAFNVFSTLNDIEGFEALSDFQVTPVSATFSEAYPELFASPERQMSSLTREDFHPSPESTMAAMFVLARHVLGHEHPLLPNRFNVESDFERDDRASWSLMNESGHYKVKTPPPKNSILKFSPGHGSGNTIQVEVLSGDSMEAPRLPDYMVDLRFILPGPHATFDTSCYELLYFLPNSYRWHHVALYLQYWGWTNPNIATFTNWTRALVGKNVIKPNSLGHHFRKAKTALDASTNNGTNLVTLLPSAWTPPRPAQQKKGDPVRDPLLRDLAVGVDISKWPTGSDRRRLTLCVEYALMNQHKGVRLSDAVDLSKRLDFGATHCEELPPNDFQLCRERVEPLLTAYTKNVLKPYTKAKGLPVYH